MIDGEAAIKFFELRDEILHELINYEFLILATTEDFVRLTNVSNLISKIRDTKPD